MLNKDEKKAVRTYLDTADSGLKMIWDYSVWLIPTLLMTIYGIWKQDYLAILVAYSGVIILIFWYLNYSHKTSKNLFSALRKYEEEVKALDKPNDK